MNIAVIGGNGYVGQKLVTELLDKTDHSVVILSRSAESANYTNPRIKLCNVDVFDTELLHEKVKNCDVVYYLVHMMGQKKIDFVSAEAKAANSLTEAIKGTSVSRIIYLGGLGNDDDNLSKHLFSRHHTGTLLRRGNAKVIEFRASMIVGKGSISYDIITNLVHKLPVLTLPAWAKTHTQPIGLSDTISYLIAAASVPLIHNEIVEIGGPEKMSYEMLMRKYAQWKKTPALLIPLPLIPVKIASWWLNIFTPKTHAKVGRMMVESLGNPMVVTNNRALELFPDIQPHPIEEHFV